MIETYFGRGALDTSNAFFMALLIGVAFGFCLERAGFGSSRRLAGIFYFRDMAVLKVMMTALITAMLGLLVVVSTGWIEPESQLYVLKTYYGSQLVAGIIFGIGFVLAGWCPGTAVVGLASGRLDALVFLFGGVLGSIFFNEIFPIIRNFYQWGQSSAMGLGQEGVSFIYEALSLSKEAFALLFTCVAVGLFWMSEVVEQKHRRDEKFPRELIKPVHPSFLRAFCAVLVFVAGSLFVIATDSTATGRYGDLADSGVRLLKRIEAGQDHIEPEELAQRLFEKEPNLLVIDVRTAQEYESFHIRGAQNVFLENLPAFLQPHKNKGVIVLYSNGMTHPAQARDILQLMGFDNVYLLTDGLRGFVERCLKPVSLRPEPVPKKFAQQIYQWRTFFYSQEDDNAIQTTTQSPVSSRSPKLVSTQWLADHVYDPHLKIIDCRRQPEYNTAHIPGSFSISPESFRGVVGGVPSVLLPADIIAAKLSLIGIDTQDTVVIVYGANRFRDATLVGMALLRVGHPSFDILDGGFGRWASEKRPLSTELPKGGSTIYHARANADTFTVNYQTVLDHLNKKSALILDTRPADYFSGEKSDEARSGHIPGAVNRPYKKDLGPDSLLPASALAEAYAALIPDKKTPVIIHCRTGHQASQTFFVMKFLLGYKNVFWYDAGWTEWASRKELPVEMTSPSTP